MAGGFTFLCRVTETGYWQGDRGWLILKHHNLVYSVAGVARDRCGHMQRLTGGCVDSRSGTEFAVSRSLARFVEFGGIFQLIGLL